MTSQNPELHKAANQLIEGFEGNGEKVFIFDHQSIYALTVKEDEGITTTRLLTTGNNAATRKSKGPNSRYRKYVKKFLSVGIDKVTFLSVNSKTNQKTVISFDKNGRIPT